MSPEENKAMLRRMIHEVIVGGDLELMDQLVAPDFINHNVVGTGETSQALGVENFRQEILALRSALTDLAIDEVHVLADGDYVIAHVSRSRTPHRGVRGRPSDRQVDVASMSIVRFENGKFAERWNLVDRYGLLQQLGDFPPP